MSSDCAYFQTQQDNTAGHSPLTVSEPSSVSSSVTSSLYTEESHTLHSVKCETEAVAPDGKSTVNHVDTGSDTEHDQLTFHIALGETGFASLGISVKKLTVGRKDLGIFIKSVLIGGTAAKVSKNRLCPLFSIVSYVAIVQLCICLRLTKVLFMFDLPCDWCSSCVILREIRE